MSCAALLVTAHLVSHHFSGTFNDRNPGATVECRRAALSVSAGTFKNSYSDQSVYGAVSWNAYHSPHAVVGPLAGVASGYRKNTKFDGDVMPFVGLRAAVKYKGFEPGFVINPLYVHLTLSYNFRGT